MKTGFRIKFTSGEWKQGDELVRGTLLLDTVCCQMFSFGGIVG